MTDQKLGLIAFGAGIVVLAIWPQILAFGLAVLMLWFIGWLVYISLGG